MSIALASLIAACSPLVHPLTMQGLISVESAGNPYAVSINRPATWQGAGVALPTFEQPRSAAQAGELIEFLHGQGFTTSIGLAQINSENLKGWQLPPRALLNPCINLYLAQQVLIRCDASTSVIGRSAPAMHLHAVLSCFNSGNAITGIRNGYAGRVQRAAWMLSTRNPTRSTAR